MCSCIAFARCRPKPGSFNHRLVASVDGHLAAASLGSPVLAKWSGTNASNANFLKSNAKLKTWHRTVVVATTRVVASESKDGPRDSKSMVDTQKAAIFFSSTKSCQTLQGRALEAGAKVSH